MDRASRSPVSVPAEDGDPLLAVFRRVGVGLCLLDGAGRVAAGNEAWLDAVGLTEGEAIGRDYWELFPDSPPELRALHDEARAGRTVELPLHPRRLGHGERWLEGRLSPLPMAGGGGVLVTIVDVTQRRADEIRRREVEAALRESEARFRLSFDQAPIGAALVSLEYRFLRVNDALCRLTGYAAEELVQTGFPQITHPDDLGPDVSEARRLVSGEIDRYELEKRYLRKDGGIVWIHLSVGLLRDPEGRPLYFLPMMQDLTARKRVEERLRHGERLESVGRLAGGIAHDFNNLLTVVLSCASGLHEDASAGRPASLDDVEQVRAAGERARDLTRQLLTFAGRQVTAPVLLDLNAAVRAAEGMLRRVLREDVSLEIDAGPGLPPVRCDPGQLDQVLVNLVVNARDAMPRGGRVVVETREVEGGPAGGGGEDPPGRWIRLTVKDTGSGMSPEVLARAFEPFFTTKPVGQGTGLGLATVHGIVTSTGGRIDVRSAPDRGTAVRIWLPPAGEPQAPVAPAPESLGAPGGTETVLVVEDEEAVRAVTVRALERAGYRVRAARDGAEALAIARAGDVHAVVTDVVMPGMSGPDVVAALRRSRPGLPALFLSGHPQDALGEATVRPGVELLAKPFTTSALLVRLRELLDRRSPGPARSP